MPPFTNESLKVWMFSMYKLRTKYSKLQTNNYLRTGRKNEIIDSKKFLPNILFTNYKKKTTTTKYLEIIIKPKNRNQYLKPAKSKI